MEYYSEKEKGFIVPGIEIQYIHKTDFKRLRFVSDELDQKFIQAISTGKIRAQIWLEKNINKASNGKMKHSWVHSYDKSNKAPIKLFTNQEYNYGGRQGWGIGVYGHVPEYSTTNGFVPTEFEVETKSINENRIIVEVDLIDLTSNMLKSITPPSDEHLHPWAHVHPLIDGDLLKEIGFIGKKRFAKFPIRARLVINYQGQVIKGDPHNVMYIGLSLHGNYESLFHGENIPTLISVSIK